MIAAAAVATCEHVIEHDEGGRVDRYAQIVATEDCRVRITGLCESASTMYLGAKNVCVASSARFIFHRPRNRFFGELPPVEFARAVNVISSFFPRHLATYYRATVIYGGSYKLTGDQIADWYDIEKCR